MSALEDRIYDDPSDFYFERRFERFKALISSLYPNSYFLKDPDELYNDHWEQFNANGFSRDFFREIIEDISSGINTKTDDELNATRAETTNRERNTSVEEVVDGECRISLSKLNLPSPSESWANFRNNQKYVVKAHKINNDGCDVIDDQILDKTENELSFSFIPDYLKLENESGFILGTIPLEPFEFSNDVIFPLKWSPPE